MEFAKLILLDKGLEFLTKSVFCFSASHSDKAEHLNE